MIELKLTKRTDPNLLYYMKVHYSQPKGFVGRSICYAVYYNSVYYGHIVAGSATKFLKGRNEFFGITNKELNNIVNNIFYHIERKRGSYPERNFTTSVVKYFVEQASRDWLNKYGDRVLGFETLIEKPRIGILYKKAGWQKVGETKGYTCKRIAGKSTDSWSGRRVWDTKNLRPKNILCIKI